MISILKRLLNIKYTNLVLQVYVKKQDKVKRNMRIWFRKWRHASLDRSSLEKIVFLVVLWSRCWLNSRLYNEWKVLRDLTWLHVLLVSVINCLNTKVSTDVWWIKHWCGKSISDQLMDLATCFSLENVSLSSTNKNII